MFPLPLPGVGWAAFLLVLFTAEASALPPLQLYLELTPSGGSVKLPPGTYAGPATIRKPLTIDGAGEVTIDGQGEGSVLTVEAEGVTLRGLHITRSGESHDKVDAAILVKARHAVIEENTIDDSLFGIHLSGGGDHVVRNNRIRSRNVPVTLRGDAIRLWYSHGNLIEGNHIDSSRDLVFANSRDNRVIGNRIRHGRLGMEFVYSPGNRVEGNIIEESEAGITVIYSDDVTLRGNRIHHLRKLTGSGISIKESYNIDISANLVTHCAVGLLATAPLEPENILYIHHNLFAFNDTALYFYGEKGNHEIHDNRFHNNFTDVMGSAPRSTRYNRWRKNSWDLYEGFDLDGDSIGDLPHEVHLFSERLWMDRSMVRLWRGTPALSLVDYMERLIPWSEPVLLFADPEPRMERGPADLEEGHRQLLGSAIESRERDDPE